MTQDAPPQAEATVIAMVGLILLVAGVVAGAWPATIVGFVVASAGLTVRTLAVFKDAA